MRLDHDELSDLVCEHGEEEQRHAGQREEEGVQRKGVAHRVEECEYDAHEHQQVPADLDARRLAAAAARQPHRAEPNEHPFFTTCVARRCVPSRCAGVEELTTPAAALIAARPWAEAKGFSGSGSEGVWSSSRWPRWRNGLSSTWLLLLGILGDESRVCSGRRDVCTASRARRRRKANWGGWEGAGPRAIFPTRRYLTAQGYLFYLLTGDRVRPSPGQLRAAV